MIDIHIHVLPGLDDGPETIEESVEMCRMCEQDGTTAVVASPHMCLGMYDVSRQHILDGVASLQQACKRDGVDLRIEPGADVSLTRDVAEMLREGRLMTVGDLGAHLMIELPQDVLPDGLPEHLYAIQLAGVTPIITHPERNLELQANPEALVPFVETGNLVQVTAASVAGDFGGRVKACAHEMLVCGMAHLVASDAHASTGRAPGLSRARQVASGLVSPEEVEDLFVRRPGMVLAGEYVQTREPVPRGTSRRKRWFFW